MERSLMHLMRLKTTPRGAPATDVRGGGGGGHEGSPASASLLEPGLSSLGPGERLQESGCVTGLAPGMCEPAGSDVASAVPGGLREPQGQRGCAAGSGGWVTRAVPTPWAPSARRIQ